MSLLIVATVICDGCGERLSGDPVSKSTEARWVWFNTKDKAKSLGWVTLSRMRRTDRHYCQKCADQPATKRKPTPPEEGK